MGDQSLRDPADVSFRQRRWLRFWDFPALLIQFPAHQAQVKEQNANISIRVALDRQKHQYSLWMFPFRAAGSKV